MRVRLHEAREIAGGASGRNGGFALRGAAVSYADARQQLGAEPAASLWRLTEQYLGRLVELAGDAFRPVGSLKLAADETERDELRADFFAEHDHVPYHTGIRFFWTPSDTHIPENACKLAFVSMNRLGLATSLSAVAAARAEVCPTGRRR
jgi:glycine/D-amino acid oxidase-like deaminating enzyme